MLLILQVGVSFSDPDTQLGQRSCQTTQLNNYLDPKPVGEYYWISHGCNKPKNWWNLHRSLKLSKRVYLVPFKASSRPNWFSSFQNYMWRPGENLDHLGSVKEFLSCTITQGIRRIPLCFYFPNLYAFTLGTFIPVAFILQHELFPFPQIDKHDLWRSCTSQRLLLHGYIMIISRYKALELSVSTKRCNHSQTATNQRSLNHLSSLY